MKYPPPILSPVVLAHGRYVRSSGQSSQQDAKSGKITEINGTRTIVKIDGKPAASVYNEWYVVFEREAREF